MAVIDRDLGWGKLLATVRTAENSYVKVGMIGAKAAEVEFEHESAESKPMTNVGLMAIHEFGTATIPERSVIRRVFDAKRGEYMDSLRKMLGALYAGRATPQKVLGVIGMKIKWDMKNAILEGAGIPPPLAEATVRAKERKGRWNKAAAKDPVRPLVDSGRMAAAIDHAVVIQDREVEVGSAVGGAVIVEGE